MLPPERDHRAIELRELRSAFDDRPEEGDPLGESRSTRLRGVADLHAVVDERDAVHREDERLRGERRRLAEAGDRPLLVVVVGEAEVERALREVAALLLPGGADLGGRGAQREDPVEGRVEGPGVVGVEGLHHEVGRAPLGEEEEVRADRLERRSGLLPEVGRDEAGHVAAEAVDARLAEPVRHHADHVTAGLRVRVVELGHVRPVGVRGLHPALRVPDVELRRRHHHAVPGRVVGHDVEDHLEASGVGLAHQPLQVIRRPVVRVERVEVPDGVRAAVGALPLLQADRMDRHEPDHRGAEVPHVIEAGGHAGEVAPGGEGSGEDLVDHGVADPVGSGSGRLAGPVAPVPGLAPGGVGERAQGGEAEGGGEEGRGCRHGASDEGGVNRHSGSG